MTDNNIFKAEWKARAKRAFPYIADKFDEYDHKGTYANNLFYFMEINGSISLEDAMNLSKEEIATRYAHMKEQDAVYNELRNGIAYLDSNTIMKEECPASARQNRNVQYIAPMGFDDKCEWAVGNGYFTECPYYPHKEDCWKRVIVKEIKTVD